MKIGLFKKTGLFKGLSIELTVCVVLLVIFFTFTAGYSKAAEIHVGPGDSIQAAVDGAAPGDSVIVSPGNYSENIIVNISELTLSSGSGNPADTRVLAEDRSSHVFHIKADGVTVRGFGISGVEEFSSSDPSTGAVGEYSSPAGIYLDDVKFGTLENNEISNFWIGVSLRNAENCSVRDSAITFSYWGIFLINSPHNRLENNSLRFNRGGINLGEYSWDNTISGNELLENSLDGIGLGCGSIGNLISLNSISGSPEGISLYDSLGNSLEENRISNNTKGILFRESSYVNKVTNNIIEANTECGFYVENSGDNLIYNNYLNNTENVKFEFMAENNTWNTTKTPGSNIVGGPFLGGNFWANPNGTGFSQTGTDLDLDGICDSPFNIGGNDYDFLPLFKPPSGEEINLSFFPFYRRGLVSPETEREFREFPVSLPVRHPVVFKHKIYRRTGHRGF